ncbi:hypothetical protein CTAYLR_003486 [Chrysophaeum taylorii]|uniref:ABC transporter domain-containing protein n=1 Tax=Chrysophaeum taylorii TaxID=2483200 RepID=A0AAD7UAH2_9STRA|nr:hypothetical protein CTAYLR_003486 [Chrysophaeum taylorii]
MMRRILLSLWVAVAAAGLATAADIEWTGLSVRRGQTTLLEPCSGEARAGRLMAILGPSGAGKTTMLRALVRASVGVEVRGTVTDGHKSLGGLRAGDAGLLAQESELFGMLSVRECLAFAHEMRGASRRRALAFTDEALERFGLSHVAHRRVGVATKQGAISGGERRRLCVAIELALSSADDDNKPSLLCADEPTSGLDSVAAEHVVRTLREYARTHGVTTIATLHQPSSRVWLECVDDLCLLAPGGRVAYRGAAAAAPAYFAREFGATLPANTNPAEWLLDLVSGDSGPLFCERWARRRESKHSPPPGGAPPRRKKRLTPFKRISLLFARSAKQVIRNKKVHALRLMSTAGLAVFLADWYGCDTPDGGDGLDVSCVADRVALLTFSAISMAMLSLVRALDLLAEEKPVVGRERERGLYRGSEYVLAKAIAEIPSDCAFAALHGWTLAWRLRSSQGTRLRCHPAIPLAAVSACASTLGLAIAAAAPTAEAALAVGTPLMVVHLLTGIVNPSGVSMSSSSKKQNLLQSISPIRHAVVWLLRREFRAAKLAGRNWPSLGGLAAVKDGDDVLRRLGLDDNTSLWDPPRAILALALSHLAVSTLCLSGFPHLLSTLLRRRRRRRRRRRQTLEPSSS